jgi:hypothetical protein
LGRERRTQAKGSIMTAKIFKFPGCLLCDDGVSILKDGKKWPDTEALRVTLTEAEQYATYLCAQRRWPRDGHKQQGGSAA